MFFKTKRMLKHNNDVLFKRNTELNKMNMFLQQGLIEKIMRLKN